MRQIKFRGKCQRGYDYSDGDGWIYGSLLQKDKVCAIVKTEDIDLSPKTDDGYSFVEDFGCVPVIPDTVGQLICCIPNTSMYVDNSQDIYDGDVFTTKGSDTKYVARYDGYGGYYGISNEGDKYGAYTLRFTSQNIKNQGIKIIGNIHDNPELLNEKQ